MIWIVTVIAIIAAINSFALYRLSMKKRLNLAAYSVYLLLDDVIREGHQIKFFEFIRQQNGDAISVSRSAMRAIEQIADELGSKGSLLDAHAMIWKVKTA